MDGEVMSENSFFKPTLLYKEFMILDLIEKESNITQREISNTIGVAVSMINTYLDDYEKKGLIKRKKHSSKTVEYFVTKKGTERKKLLNIWYLKSSHEVYLSAKDNIIKFLNQIIDKGFKKILLYGAGEVAEIMLQVMNDDNNIPLEILAVVDDDVFKQNEIIVNKPIISNVQIKSFDHDGILVSSFKHHDAINAKLDLISYNKNNIINFFDN
jgi:DNA-binding MarR family transcriptional regulator